MGNKSEGWPARALGDGAHAGFEQGRIAAELVDQKAADQHGIGGVEHGLGSDDLRDHAAAIDVADQHDRRFGRARKPHVGDIVGAQVDLGRAAGALHQHEIGARGRDARSFRARLRAASASSSDSRSPSRCRSPGRAARPARRSRSEVSAARDSCARWRARGRRGPGTPGRGRSRRHPRSPPRCWTCSAA